MEDLMQKESELKELKHLKSFGSIERTQANEETSVSMKNPDTMLSMIVLLLACVGLAVLADIVIWVTG
jgi:hypothetical protein